MDEETTKKLIRDEIEAGFKDRFNATLSKLDDLNSTIGTLTKNMDDDRKTLTTISGSQGKVERLSAELVSTVNNQTIRISAKAQEIIDLSLKTVDAKIEDAIIKAINKIKKGNPLKKSRPFWKFWG
jgi:CRISPR/Cas system Type II protein with McrA/HNH and RuvC-like nuclease domain